MRRALDEMDRRRTRQVEYNAAHGVTPTSIVKSMEEIRLATHFADARSEKPTKERRSLLDDLRDPAKRATAMKALEQQMREAAANLEFELAAMLRDQLNELRALDAGNVRRGPDRPRRSAARARS
jgi:excinuclease ABC subunit B